MSDDARRAREESLKRDAKKFKEWREKPLKYCPFCGNRSAGVKWRNDGGKVFYVRCPKCWAQGPVTLTWKKAETRWNTRWRLVWLWRFLFGPGL